MESILNTIKKMLGIELDCTDFDLELVPHINSVLMAVIQLGVGPSTGLMILDDKNMWTELLGVRKDLESVKTYIYLKTRLLFDPPQSSFLIEAFKKEIAEIEWRLNIQVEGRS